MNNILAVSHGINQASPINAVEAPSSTFEKPRLVLQITVDQMRGDFPMRYKDRLGEGGFRYLMEKGTHYINAHFQHADTETPIGHAALFTGTYPAKTALPDPLLAMGMGAVDVTTPGSNNPPTDSTEDPH